MNVQGRRKVRLALERLESREMPTTSPWSLETFDRTALGALPVNWLQYSSDGASGFQTSQARTLASPGALATTGGSVAENRAWLKDALPADAQVGVNVYLDSLIPAQIIARGQNLDTASASYYAVSVSRGLQLQLLRVTNGQTSVLATLRSSEWISNQWVRVSLTTVGETLKVQVFRADTGQYLNADGRWQFTAANALTAQDAVLTDGGFAGLGRSASYSGSVHFDNFTVGPPTDNAPATLVEESFGRPLPGGLPAGWSQWNGGASSFQVSTLRAQTYSGGLTLVNPTADSARAWYDSPAPADVDVGAAIYADSLVPAQIIARGQNLDSDTPSFYAVQVARGLELQLVRVSGGHTTVLKTLDSQGWLSGQWVHVTLSLHGDDLRVMAYRHDSGQYLAADGSWNVAPTWAMETHDASLTDGGRVGLGKAAGYTGSVTFDNFTATQGAAATPSPPDATQDDFETTSVGQLAPQWSQWSNNQPNSFQVTDEAALSGSHSLATLGASDTVARAWLTTPFGPDAEVSASIYLDSLVPARLILRGQGLDSTTPSYYAVSVNRGLDLQLLRVTNGQTTTLSTLSSNTWDSNIWARVQLNAQGGNLQVQVIRLDNGAYLNQNGDWQSDPAVAMSVADDGLTQGGLAGLVRPASYSGRVLFDDFAATAIGGDPAAPPPTGDPAPPPTGSSPGTTQPPPGTTNTPPPVSAPPAALPPIARHYTHIRLAELAYHGTPLGSFEQNLLRNSIDVVIPNTDYLNQISAISANTPQFIYTNASNIYRELFTDWLAWADRNGVDREAAFYHVKSAQPFTGDSASSYPVAWFWSVQVGADGNWSDQTTPAHDGVQQISFGGTGQVVALGNTEQFREINVNLGQVAANGWSGVLEYASATDAAGNPTAWKTLHLLADGTGGFHRSGQITFDPPTDWVTASINGSARLYFVRIRTTADGTAPVANNITGRDYVNAGGLPRGTIPAFDRAADLDGDGYLNDAEYARRQAGMNARFVYESRVFYPAYGQNRFATNVANADYRRWVADFSTRFLNQNPQADGLFLDNSLGKISIDPTTTQESLANYADNYAELLAGVNRAIAPKWVLANIAGGGLAADALARRGISYLEEFAIRPMAASYSQFEDVAANLERRLSLSAGKSYAILDSLATGNQSLDARWQIGTMAYYYLLADPNQTMLMFNGGNEPNSTWTRHWSPAVQFNVGQPRVEWSAFAQGTDPTNATMTYKVYQREYDNALVLYKPLSYYRGVSGTTVDGTATTHNLGAYYRPLHADGTLGTAINRITLRNGEGAILVKV